MRLQGRTRLLLFTAVAVIPNAVLIAAALLMARQDRQLESGRRDERRVVLVTRLGQELVTRLSGIRERVLGQPIESLNDVNDSTLVFVAGLRGNALEFPWQRRSTLQRESAGYARLIAAAEAAEFRDRAPDAAASLYRQAATAAVNDVERGEALLREARTLARHGDRNEALIRYRTVAMLPASIRDDDGMPLALYAAQSLLAVGSAWADSGRATVNRMLEATALFDAPTLLAIRDLAGSAGLDARRPIEQRLEMIDQARQLQNSVPALVALRSDRGGQSSWIAFGPAPWLVSFAETGAGRDSLVMVVRPSALLAAIAAEGGPLSTAAGVTRPTSSPEPGSEPLDISLAGLQAVFTDESVLATGDSSVLARIFLLVLPIVAMLTLLVAWLFWRDVRREVAAAELRSQFVSGVSHELKTPLTSIRMFAETLLMGRPAHDEGRREYLETIVQESERLTRLINNVLDFSRIERGEQHYRFAPMDLAGVVRDSARAMAYPLGQNGFDLSLNVPDESSTASVDRDAVMQAILNLLSNAMKYSGESKTIELSLAQRNGDALIEVRDHGVGIAEKDQKRIFDRYYRTPETEASNIPGTGLGLSLVAHVAEAHHGSVRVDSAPGRGSTFTLQLPLERKE